METGKGEGWKIRGGVGETVMGRIRVRSGMDDGGRRGDRGSYRSAAGVPVYLEGTKKKGSSDGDNYADRW